MPQSPFIDIVNGRPVINPGSMRHQISLLQLTEPDTTVRDAGGVVRSWQPFLNAKAAISLYRGKELISDTQTASQSWMIIAMYYQPGVLPSQRVQALNGTYLIQAIENVLELNFILELLCLAIGDNQ